MSIEADRDKYLHDEAVFNKAVEALIPVVEEDYIFFESFLMDEAQEYYDKLSDKGLRSLHGAVNNSGRFNAVVDNWLAKKFNEHVLNEAMRRAEG